MFRYFIVLFLILLSDFSFAQTIVLTQTNTNAIIGLDRKAFIGLGNTSAHSDGYAHDFTLPTRTNPCQQITDITVDVNLTGYTNIGGCPHTTLYYNLFYGCSPYAGGATCLPATNLIAEPNYPPNTSPPPFVFGSPLGSPQNPNIVPDFGDNLSVDIIPVSIPGCNAVTNGNISYQYTITVTVTVINIPSTPTIPIFTPVSPICAGDTLSALPTTSNNGIIGTWSPALDNYTTTTYTFTPAASECALTSDLTISVNQPPPQPTLACYETATMNISTCAWEITGTQPAPPAIVNCWDNFVFNATTCAWDNIGSQPVPPTINCYETATFNASTCLWEITGTQPIQPALECWETAIFNTNTCSWEVSGTQPGNVIEERLDLCEGEILNLIAQTNITNPAFAWSTGESIQDIIINSASTYTVEITGATCAFETRIFNVTLLETPIIENVISDGNDIIITTTNSGNFEYSLDGNTFQSNNIFYNIDGGLYNIYVKTQNCNNNVIIEHLHFYIPKFFTPNGDGVNDGFDLSGIEFFNSSEISIFNRHGKLLKFSRNSTFSWDGTYAGEQLPSDDYWYIIIVEGQKLTGHFTLKR